VIRFSLLGSGSKGNAVYVVAPGAKILIDSGFSYKRLCERLAAIGEQIEGLQAVFVTHEHIDHVRGLGVLSRKLRVPIYITPATFENLPDGTGQLDNVHYFEAGSSLRVGDLTLTSFSVSHDAADPVGYVVQNGTAKLGIATDLGHTPTLVKMRLAGANALILESNHCPQMLLNGTYPPSLQQRIRSKFGHLSNADMTSLLSELIHDALRFVVLAHISEENNDRRLAYEMALGALKGHPAEVFVARQDCPTRLFEISG